MVAFHFKHDSLYGPWHCRLYARGSEPDKITSSAFVPKWLPLKQASSSQDLRRQHRRYSSADAGLGVRGLTHSGVPRTCSETLGIQSLTRLWDTKRVVSIRDAT